jgi:hypothetical protein
MSRPDDSVAGGMRTKLIGWTPISLVKAQPTVPAPIAGGQVDSVVGIGGGAARGVLPVLNLPGLGI